MDDVFLNITEEFRDVLADAVRRLWASLHGGGCMAAQEAAGSAGWLTSAGDAIVPGVCALQLYRWRHVLVECAGRVSL